MATANSDIGFVDTGIWDRMIDTCESTADALGLRPMVVGADSLFESLALDKKAKIFVTIQIPPFASQTWRPDK